MANALDNLGGQVLGRTTKREGLLTLFGRLNSLLAETEVCNLKVTIAVQQHVFRLEVPIDNSILVQAPDCFHKLSRIEACSPL